MNMDDRPGNTKAILMAVGAVVMALLLISAIGYVWGLNQIDEGQVGVHTERGAATGEVHDPGWHWANPITQNVHPMDIQPNTVNYNGGKEGDGIYVITEDGQDVWVDVTVRYSVNESEAVTFFSNYSTHKQAQNRLIEPTVRSDLRDEASNISTRDVITQEGRERLTQTVDEALRDNFDGSGLALEAVQVRGVELNEEYSNQLEQVEIANTERERKLIEAEADADAQRERAQGDADANEIRDESITDDVLKDKWLDQIDDSDKVIVTDGSGEDIMIDTSNQSPAQSGGNTSG